MDRRANPLQAHIAYLRNTSHLCYLHKLINIKPRGSTCYLTILHYSVHAYITLKIFDRCFQQTAHTL